MSDTKTFILPEGGNSSVDPNLMLAMGGGGFGGFGGGNFLGYLLIFLLFGRDGLYGGRGFDMNYINSQTNCAIQGVQNSVGNLATQLSCTEGQIQSAIQQIQSAIQQNANANNMNAMQVINAIQAGNTSIANQISQCCCDNKLLTTTQGYENRINNLQQSQLIQNGFSQVGYAAAEQTCAIKQNTTDNTSRVLAKLDAIEDSRKDREISSLTAALTAANSRAERQAELAPIYKQLNDIACKQPQTFTVPYQPFTAIPNCVAYGMGLYSGFPYAQGGNIWS